MYTIPFETKADFSMTTTLDGVVLNLRFFWNANSASWYMDLDAVNKSIKFTGLRMATRIRLLEGYAVRELGDFAVIDKEVADRVPTFEGMGSRWQLVYFTKADMASKGLT